MTASGELSRKSRKLCAQVAVSEGAVARSEPAGFWVVWSASRTLTRSTVVLLFREPIEIMVSWPDVAGVKDCATKGIPCPGVTSMVSWC